MTRRQTRPKRPTLISREEEVTPELLRLLDAVGWRPSDATPKRCVTKWSSAGQLRSVTFRWPDGWWMRLNRLKNDDWSTSFGITLTAKVKA